MRALKSGRACIRPSLEEASPSASPKVGPTHGPHAAPSMSPTPKCPLAILDLMEPSRLKAALETGNRTELRISFNLGTARTIPNSKIIAAEKFLTKLSLKPSNELTMLNTVLIRTNDRTMPDAIYKGARLFSATALPAITGSTGKTHGERADKSPAAKLVKYISMSNNLDYSVTLLEMNARSFSLLVSP